MSSIEIRYRAKPWLQKGEAKGIMMKARQSKRNSTYKYGHLFVPF